MIYTAAPWEIGRSTENEVFIEKFNNERNCLKKIAKVGGLDREGNARRITVAVNACDGIPTDMLEEGIIKKAMADFEMMRIENNRMKMRIEVLELEKAGLIEMVDDSKSAGEVLSELELKWKKMHTGYPKEPALFIGTPTGIEDIDEVPNISKNDEQIKDYQKGGGIPVWKTTTKEGADILQWMERQKEIVKKDLGKIIGEENRKRIEKSEAINEAMMEAGRLRAERREAEMYPPDPDEPDYDNQAKDYDEDRRWEGSPTEYDQ